MSINIRWIREIMSILLISCVITGIAVGSIDVNFSADATTGEYPLDVNFTDQTGIPQGVTILSWNWTFGDGSNSTQQNPHHTYTDEGVYDISLTVETGNETESITKSSYISVYQVQESLDASNPSDPKTAFGTLTLLTPLTGQNWEMSPGIYGEDVVWSGYTDTSYDIFWYQVSEGTETDITPDTTSQNPPDYPYPDQDAPAIDGNFIVWQDSRNVYWDIFLYDISNGTITQITENTNESNQVSPDISDSIIVWADDRNKGESRYDLFLLNRSSGEETLLSPDLTEVSLEHPRISGHYVVCEGLDLLNRTYDIYLCNLQDTSWAILTPGTSSTDQKNADIFGDYVVWDGYDELNGTLDVFLYSITSGSTSLLTNDTTQSSQMNPSLSNSTVVWEDSQFKEGGATDIVLCDLLTGSHYLLTPDSVTDQRSPEIFENRIVWQGLSADWNWDIYLFTLGVEKPDLVAGFSANISTGGCPLTVTFNDTSTGEPEFWHWDFGDGNSSDEQHPVHSYTTSGSYDVTLLTGNPYQRGGERKDSLVSVQAPPVCRFSADPVSGIAPLLVQFSDESSGEPQSWNWDFGDGNTSDLEHPMYEFSNPGTYTVTLTVMNSYGNSSLEKNDMIMVANATGLTMNCEIPGLSIEQNDDNQVLILDVNVSPPALLNTDGRVLMVYPDTASGIDEVVLQAGDAGFSTSGNTITGVISSACVKSPEIVYYPARGDHGQIAVFNYSICMEYYPVQGSYHTDVWEGVLPGDYAEFDKALDDYTPFGDIHDIAYTMTLENTAPDSACTITAGVDAAWVRRYGEGDNGSVTIETTPPAAAVYIDEVYRGKSPITVTGLVPGTHQMMLSLEGYLDEKYTFRIRDERDSIKILKIGDDGTAEVLNTTFVYHDPVQNLDYFQAYSPHGGSKFSVSALGGPGSIFQMLYLTISSYVKPQSGSAAVGGGGGGGGTYSGVAGLGISSTPVATPTPDATLTPRPTITSAEPTSSPNAPPSTLTDTNPTTQETFTSPNNTGQASPPVPGTAMILVRNLAVVAVVALVTVIFYFRWKKQ